MKVLLATDGSECAHAAVEFMERFPFRREGEATVLTVIDRDDFKGREEAQLSDEQRELLREARVLVQRERGELLGAKAERLRRAGWTVATEIRDGHPAEEIVDAARERDVDLVVLGCHGLSGIDRIFLGSISDTVLKHAHCSVMVVKSPPTTKAGSVPNLPLRLLVAYDGSGAAMKAVRFCASLPYREADQVTLLSVLPLIGLYRQDIRLRLSGIWREKRKNAVRELERVAGDSDWATPNVSTQLLENSDVRQAILNAVSKLDAPLLVLGYKGKGAIEKFLMGSITSGIAHHTPCSILVVR